MPRRVSFLKIGSPEHFRISYEDTRRAISSADSRFWRTPRGRMIANSLPWRSVRTDGRSVGARKRSTSRVYSRGRASASGLFFVECRGASGTSKDRLNHSDDGYRFYGGLAVEMIHGHAPLRSSCQRPHWLRAAEEAEFRRCPKSRACPSLAKPREPARDDERCKQSESKEEVP